MTGGETVARRVVRRQGLTPRMVVSGGRVDRGKAEGEGQTEQRQELFSGSWLDLVGLFADCLFRAIA